MKLFFKTTEYLQYENISWYFQYLFLKSFFWGGEHSPNVTGALAAFIEMTSFCPYTIMAKTVLSRDWCYRANTSDVVRNQHQPYPPLPGFSQVPINKQQPGELQGELSLVGLKPATVTAMQWQSSSLPLDHALNLIIATKVEIWPLLNYLGL